MSGNSERSAPPPGSPMAQLPLDTGRLILRPYAQDDAPAVAALRGA